jgi:hypothetical protein
MNGHGHGPREDPLTDLGYETRDINIPGLRNTAMIFFGFATFCFVVVAVWFWWYKPQMTSTVDLRKPLPKITLQSNISVRADIQILRQNETQKLGYRGGNMDGSLHIPINDAINLIAARGLPRTESNVQAVSRGTTIPQNAVGPGRSGSATAGGNR